MVVGHIGTEIEIGNISQYIPASNTLFYMNTGAPADANGTITSVRYCYTLSTLASSESNFYQATVGIYRPEGNESYNLKSFFILTNASMSSNSFQCKQLNVPANIEVEKGDVLGVCQWDFNFSNTSLGHINLIASTTGGSNESLQQLSPSLTEKYCTPLGMVPEKVADSDLTKRDERLSLLLSANISEQN